MNIFVSSTLFFYLYFPNLYKFYFNRDLQVRVSDWLKVKNPEVWQYSSWNYGQQEKQNKNWILTSMVAFNN